MDEEHFATPTSEKIIPLSTVIKKVTMGFLAVSPISLNVERLIVGACFDAEEKFGVYILWRINRAQSD